MLGAGGGLWWSGVSPQEIFENSDAKSCILVTTWQYLLWHFLLFENHDQEVGGPVHCWPPNLQVGWPVSAPVPTVVAPLTTIRYTELRKDQGMIWNVWRPFVERVAVGMRESSNEKRLGTRQAQWSLLRLRQPSGAVPGWRKTPAIL